MPQDVRTGGSAAEGTAVKTGASSAKSLSVMGYRMRQSYSRNEQRAHLRHRRRQLVRDHLGKIVGPFATEMRPIEGQVWHGHRSVVEFGARRSGGYLAGGHRSGR